MTFVSNRILAIIKVLTAPRSPAGCGSLCHQRLNELLLSLPCLQCRYGMPQYSRLAVDCLADDLGFARAGFGCLTLERGLLLWIKIDLFAQFASHEPLPISSIPHIIHHLHLAFKASELTPTRHHCLQVCRRPSPGAWAFLLQCLCNTSHVFYHRALAGTSSCTVFECRSANHHCQAVSYTHLRAHETRHD